jgi:hypothetical protein
MRLAHLLALVASSGFLTQSVVAQSSLLSQVEQGLQAPGGTPAAGAASGYLGAILDDEGQMDKGVLVAKVSPGTPAAKSGLKDNDLITHVDGKPVPNLDAYDAVAKRPAGSTINMTIVRDGKSQPLPVTLGTRPASPNLADPNAGETAPAAPTTQPSLTPPGSTAPSSSPPGPAASGTAPSLLPATGAAPPGTSPSPADAGTRAPGIIAQPQAAPPPATETPASPSGGATGGRASLGVRLPQPGAGAARTQRGALIESVNPGTPAEQAGLKAGQMIVGIDGKRIDSDDELIAAIKARQPGQSVELQYRDGVGGSDIRTTTVRLAQAGAATGGAGGAATPGSGSPPRAGTGFGSSFAPGPAPAPADNPQRPGAGGSRPLLDRIDRIADNFSPRPSSTVYDPEAFAVLQKRITDLENRLRMLESKVGGAPATPGSSSTPGFNPSIPPQTTPGFGAPSGGVAPSP